MMTNFDESGCATNEMTGVHGCVEILLNIQCS